MNFLSIQFFSFLSSRITVIISEDISIIYMRWEVDFQANSWLIFSGVNSVCAFQYSVYAAISSNSMGRPVWTGRGMRGWEWENLVYLLTSGNEGTPNPLPLLLVSPESSSEYKHHTLKDIYFFCFIWAVAKLVETVILSLVKIKDLMGNAEFYYFSLPFSTPV